MVKNEVYGRKHQCKKHNQQSKNKTKAVKTCYRKLQPIVSYGCKGIEMKEQNPKYNFFTSLTQNKSFDFFIALCK